MAGRKLITVEATFLLKGRGLIVSPGPSMDSLGIAEFPHSCPVLIKRPDGSTLAAEATFYIPHVSPLEAQLRHLQAPRLECVLSELDKSDVPIGSEIYVQEAR